MIWDDIQHCRVCVRSDLSWEVLAGLGERLWSQECRSSHCARQQGVSSLKLVADPKVSYFNVSIITNQQVRWLNITVNDLLIVYFREEARTSSFVSTANSQNLSVDWGGSFTHSIQFLWAGPGSRSEPAPHSGVYQRGPPSLHCTHKPTNNITNMRHN